MTNRCGIRCAASVLLVAAGVAQAQWTVTNLHPADSNGSGAAAVAAGEQAGGASVPWEGHACVWHGSAATWVDLNPAGAARSRADAVDGGHQVGRAVVGGDERASLWSGTAESWVNLHPPESHLNSYAADVSGDQQVGTVRTDDGVWRASLWTGSAASWVDLSAGIESDAFGVDAGVQVGRARIGGNMHAGLWKGTAASWQDINPAGADGSTASAVHSSHQVGIAAFGGVIHAGVWNGSAASWVDLHPAGATESQANDVYEGRQVGYAIIDGVQRAGLWTGSSASWTDLHAFLTAEFANSVAEGIWSDADVIYVAGWGRNTRNDRDEALLWTAFTGCRPDCNKDGKLNINDFICMQAKWRTRDPYGDYDGSGTYTVNDFIRFQADFVRGCE